MSTLSDVRIVWGKGASKMSPAERRRADGFWRQRMERAERIGRLYPKEQQ